MSRAKSAVVTDPEPVSLRGFDQSLPMALLKAREAAMARFRPMLRRHGLTEQQWRVIRTLAAFEPIDATQLARHSFLLAPSLSRILQFLESENLVLRHADSSDQRRSVVRLSDAGREKFAAVAPDAEALYADIEQAFGAKRLDRLYDLLAEFHDQLAGQPGDESAA